MNKLLNFVKMQLSHIEDNISNNKRLSEDEIKNLRIRYSIFEDIQYQIKWEVLTSVEKQQKRIEWLASMKKRNAPNSHKQLLAIQIYEAIKVSEPYINMLNDNNYNMSKINEICNKEKEVIDAGYFVKNLIISNEEVEEAFKIYFEAIKLLNNDCFSECYERIDFLYEKFKSATL